LNKIDAMEIIGRNSKHHWYVIHRAKEGGETIEKYLSEKLAHSAAIHFISSGEFVRELGVYDDDDLAPTMKCEEILAMARNSN
jgi:hypothetical protein